MRRSSILLLVLVLVAVFAIYQSMRPVAPPPRSGASSKVELPSARTEPATARTAQPVPGEHVGATALITVAYPENTAVLNTALPAPSHAVSYVRIDRAQIEAKSSPFWRPKGGRIELPMPGGQTLGVAIDDSEMLGANRFTSTGHIEGQPESRAVFAYNAGYLTASIIGRERSYALRPATETLSQWYEIDPALVGNCGGARHPQPDPSILGAIAARKAREMVAAAEVSAGDTPATAAAADGTQRPEVHVLMLYTQAVKTTMSGAARVAALQSEFDECTARVNADLAASQINARVKLVRIAETQYDADNSLTPGGTVQNDALTALHNTSDGKMDEIHAVRNSAGADIVCLIHNRPDSYSVGLAFVLDAPARVDVGVGLYNPWFAFAVVYYGVVTGTDVVAHEFGHLFGCAHARGDDGATGTKDGAYTYSYGYRFFGSNGLQYRDIMAYAPGTRLSYFSTPRIVVPAPVSRPIGIAAGQPGESDCALTIEQNAFEVAGYRLQTQAAPAGTLVNVSTRAFVGTGDSVLIGGFVMGSTQSKRVLIRAAGPALLPAGVTDFLPNPRFRVVSHSGTTVAENDDWGTQPNAAEIAVRAADVGAFAFAPGSTDAAALITLSPDAYTTVVEGVGGATGSSIVEVYDIDRVGEKIINLSTRGYADKDRELFGGFVVDGAAGTTKRILIRALGPTLARPPYNVSGAMSDPMFSLYNGAYELVLKNDDWSTGTTSGRVGAEEDFSPLVKYYSEEHIAATGQAPSNRREPCIMADLPPGNYTVIVQPFERLGGSNPQPAEPGVATIEVFEITQ